MGGLRFLARLFAAILFVGGTFGAVFYVYVWATTSPRFAVTTVTIDGNERATLDELAPLTGIGPGNNIFLVDGRAAQRRIQGHPWVRSVAVRREPPDRVTIAVREYEPAIIVALGALYLADAEGTVFKQAMAGDGVDLPILSGIDADEGDAHVRAEILRGLDLIARWESSGLMARLELSQIELDPLRGASLTATGPGEDDLPVVIHLAANGLDERLDRLSNLLALLSERGERPKEVFLDNRTRPQWVVARVDE
jgi:cell division protein FtsQ